MDDLLWLNCSNLLALKGGCLLLKLDAAELDPLRALLLWPPRFMVGGGLLVLGTKPPPCTRRGELAEPSLRCVSSSCYGRNPLPRSRSSAVAGEALPASRLVPVLVGGGHSSPVWICERK